MRTAGSLSLPRALTVSGRRFKKNLKKIKPSVDEYSSLGERYVEGCFAMQYNALLVAVKSGC